jgi:hypothetical protein
VTSTIAPERSHKVQAAQSAGPALVLLAIAGIAYLAGFAWVMTSGSFEAWRGMVVGPALFLLSAPMLASVHRRDGPRLSIVFGSALVLKILAAVVVYLVAESIYDGVADYRLYHEQGELVADQLRQRWWPIDVGHLPLIGTAFVYVVTGAVQLLVGPSVVGVGMVFSWLGFLGYYWMFRAFRTALPDAPPMRFAVMLLLLPSMLFWPSTIGKDAWMSMSLGLAALGMARVLTRTPRGVVLLVLGLTAATAVRPHIALMFFVAFTPAFVLRRSRGNHVITPGKVFGLALLLVLGLLLVSQVEAFFGIESLNNSSAEQVLEKTRGVSSTGGSEFTARLPSLATLPLSVVDVLFRPFPLEAHNFQTILASIEGLVLLGLCIMSFRRVRSALRRMLAQPFLLGCVLYVLLFAAAFGAVGNFGILARQRVQVLPFVFVLLNAPVGAFVRRKMRTQRSALTPHG